MPDTLLKILAVEDDEFMRIFLKDTFWIHGGKSNEVRVVSDLRKARDILEKGEFRPKVVLLDLNLPEEEGGRVGTEGSFKFLEKLKTDPQTKDIKVIVFSGYGDDEIKKRVKDLGADRFMAKGDYMPQEIIKAIREVAEA